MSPLALTMALRVSEDSSGTAGRAVKVDARVDPFFWLASRRHIASVATPKAGPEWAKLGDHQPKLG